MKTNRLLRISFIAAPAFLFLYGVAHFFDGRDGTYGPGIAWTVGHIMFVLGLVALCFVIAGLYSLIEKRNMWNKILTRCAMGVGLVGLILFIRSPIIDIVAGLRASDHTAMGALQSQLNAYPSTPLSPYYNFGPLLFQLGLLVLMVQLAAIKPHKLPWWSPVVLLAGFLVLGLDLDLLMVGAVLIGIALLPLNV